MRHTADISETFTPRDMTEEEIRQEMNPIYGRVEHEQKIKKTFYVGFALAATAMAAGGYLALQVWNNYK